MRTALRRNAARLLLGVWIPASIPVADAQIVADPGAAASQRPTVLAAPNGVPVVNVRTPSAAGVSHNTYSQFDVQAQGAILNNSRVDVLSQQGGWLQGNPWLAGGGARVILSEVRSANPSQLRGYVEVAGPRAEVIVANPSGIAIDGGGFINASRVTLSTGTPVMSGGALVGHRVEGGTVTIGGAGFDASRADYAAILARAVEVNAGIWAQELRIVTGANDIDAAHERTTPLTANGAAPTFAIDVAQLGGIYAGRISLVGTEAGVGVRNAGHIGAQAGEVVITADGRLQNAGLIGSSGDTRIAARDIANSGTVYAQNDLGVTARDSLASAGGTMIAAKRLAVDAGSIAGTGSLLSQQDIDIRTQGDFDNRHEVVADRDVQVRVGGTLTNRALVQAGRRLELGARNIDNLADAEISAFEARLDASEALVNRGLIDGVQTVVRGARVANLGSGRIFGDQLALAADTLNNAAETIDGVPHAPVVAARERLDIGARLIDNRDDALLFSAGDLAIGGALDADARATGQAEVVNNNGATIEALGRLDLSTASLNNTNAHFETTVVADGAPERRFTIQPYGSSTRYDGSNFVWVPWSRAGALQFVGTQEGQVVLGGTAIPRVDEQDCTGEAPNEVCHPVPGSEYPATDPAWAWFRLPPPDPAPLAPASAAPVAPDPADAASCATGGPGYNASACSTYTAALANYNANLTTWEAYLTTRSTWEAETAARRDALDARIETYNGDFVNVGRVALWTQYDTTVSRTRTDIVASQPGRILSGGDMRFVGENLVNDKSRIIAGGALVVEGSDLRNIAAEGERTTREAGTSQFTKDRWRGGFRRYYQRDWFGILPFTPADIVETVTLPVTEVRERTAPNLIGAGTGLNVAGVALPAAVPTSALYHVNPDPNGTVLIETDPRFTDRRQWLSSDYMLQALAVDPTTTQKRLGDGFYEQRLIGEQVAELTGRRFLGDYATEEEQFRALMDAGITYAKDHDLRPGVTLSAEQMAQLTSNIAWLVEREVKLPDGSARKVLVPQVFVRPNDAGITPGGALIAGDAVDVLLANKLDNSGTISARTRLAIKADHIHDAGGRIAAAQVALGARQDVEIIGGRVDAGSSLLVSAGRDLKVESTTHRDTKVLEHAPLIEASGGGRNGIGRLAGRAAPAPDSVYSRTDIDRVAGLYVAGSSESAGSGGMLVAAGRDATFTAASVVNAAGPKAQTAIVAGRDLKLDTVRTSLREDTNADAHNFNRRSRAEDVGTVIRTTGDLSLDAANDLTAKAATLDAKGALEARAGRDIRLLAGEASQSLDQGYRSTHRNAVSKTRVTDRIGEEQSLAVGSAFGGATVALRADRDVQLVGSRAIGDFGTRIDAGRDLALDAGINTFSSHHAHEARSSGATVGRGSLNVGTRELGQEGVSRSTTHTASTVGAVAGDVALTATQAYRQTASEVLAPKGDIAIAARQVDIVEAQDTREDTQTTRFRQSGFSASVSSPLLDGYQSVRQMHRARGNTDDERMKALAVASAAMAVGNAIQSASPIKVNVGFGSSKSESRSTQTASLAAGSTVAAGGDVRIEARREGSGDSSGDGSENGGRVGASSTNPAADGNLTIRGSRITAGGDADLPSGGNVILAADGDLRLLAAKNTREQHSSDRSSSAFVGISVGDPKSMGVTASGSRGRGNADGKDVFWTNTQVEAGNRLTIESGGDTTLKSAVAKGKEIVANVGGKLLVESLQDTSDYRSRHQSIGGSVTVGPAPGGSVSVGRSKIDSTYASVAEQSGIKAGDGGFDISVRGDSELKGGMIASTQAAVDANRNRFATGGTLALADIENRASYEAKAFAVSAGVGSSLGASAGLGRDDGQAASTTRAGISGIAGHKDVRTGDAETGITKIFDAGKVQKDIDAQVQITQTFTREAPKAVATFAQTKTKPIDDAEKYRDIAALRARGELNADQAEALAKLEHDGLTPEKAQATLNDPQAKKDYENWKEGGAYRVALHTLSGALVGGVGGALGAGTVSGGAEHLKNLQNNIENTLFNLGLPRDAAKVAAQGIGQLTALAIGSLAGPQGAATALAVDANNRQLHPTEARLIKDNAQRYADKRGISLDQAEAELTQQALRNVDSAHATRLGPINSLAQDFQVEIAAGQALTDPMTGQSYRLFAADEATRDNHAMFGQYAKADATTETALDRAYLPKYQPAKGQTIEGVSGSNAGALTGSDLALMDAATDRKHMIHQPPAVQWAVLGQLRHERQENLKAQAALIDESHAFYSRGDNSLQAAQRRTDIEFALIRLETEDQKLRVAGRELVLTMGIAGLLRPAYERELIEGFGEGRSMAGVSLKGLSSASIVARYNMLKASIQETRAIAEAERAAAAVEGTVANRGINPELAQRLDVYKAWKADNAQNYASNAEAMQAYRKLVTSESPWPDGFTPISTTIDTGTRFRMAISPGQPVNRPGAFGTFDDIPNVDYVRSQLAVKSAWKPEVDRVVTYEVIKPLPARLGPVGPQADLGAGRYLPGGGSQLQFDVPGASRMDYVRVVDVTKIK